jgi:hypothetical protein
MNTCCINVSIGELFDKYTILLIKKNKIIDQDKLNYINKELEYLKPYIKKYNIDKTLFDNLLNINNKLWDIEDNIRKKEYNKEFDNEFIELARSVYINNDKRAEIKNHINIFLKSELIEIKNYHKYI